MAMAPAGGAGRRARTDQDQHLRRGPHHQQQEEHPKPARLASSRRPLELGRGFWLGISAELLAPPLCLELSSDWVGSFFPPPPSARQQRFGSKKINSCMVTRRQLLINRLSLGVDASILVAAILHVGRTLQLAG